MFGIPPLQEVVEPIVHSDCVVVLCLVKFLCPLEASFYVGGLGSVWGIADLLVSHLRHALKSGQLSCRQIVWLTDMDLVIETDPACVVNRFSRCESRVLI